MWAKRYNKSIDVCMTPNNLLALNDIKNIHRISVILRARRSLSFKVYFNVYSIN